MELLRGFGRFKYPNEIGPGVYDIHSPRVPSTEEIVTLLERAAEVIEPRRLWVNPDCGLKTRRWPEVLGALTHMVAAARLMSGLYRMCPPQAAPGWPRPAAAVRCRSQRCFATS